MVIRLQKTLLQPQPLEERFKNPTCQGGNWPRNPVSVDRLLDVRKREILLKIVPIGRTI